MLPAQSPKQTQIRALTAQLGSGLRQNVSLAPLTTFRIGGPAAWFFQARNADQLATAVSAARQLRIAHFVLGCGANILVGDHGYPGLVIHNQAGGAHIIGNRLVAGSGAIIYPDIIDTARAAGLSGLEHFAGIPSTVGGGIWQNLHFLSPPPERARTQFLDEVFESAEILTADNQRLHADRDYFCFGYDYSILHSRADIVLEASFALTPADPSAIQRVIDANLLWRAQRHPPLTSLPSAGSIFRKIEGIGAGRLIDECGLKGQRLGDAQISPRHANIIINRGQASAADVCGLISQAQQAVWQHTGHWLTPEIGFVGCFTPVRRFGTHSAAG